ncbi:MAG: PQQ-binding-like beta-propeller repeat protein [Planctomycetaceae bacterium]
MSGRNWIGVVTTLGSVILAAGSGRTDDWPQWRGLHRDGVSHEHGRLADWTRHPPKLEWNVAGMGRGYASVSIADGRLYTTGNFDNGQGVVCVDARSGVQLWRRTVTSDSPQHSYPGSRCTPTIDGDRLYAITSDGRIACLKTDDGEVVWSQDFQQWGGKMMSGWGYSESPLVDGDRVICTPGGPGAMLVALDKRTGNVVWKSDVPDFNPGKSGAGYSSIVISQGGGVKQYVTLIGAGAVGVRADDGKFLWGYARIANKTANISTPLVGGDHVFVSTGYQTGAALLKLVPKDGGVEAKEEYFLDSKTFQNQHGQMVLIDGHVYAGNQHRNGFPICVELASGKVAWGGTERGPGTGSAAINAAGGHVIFRYQDGVVALIEATPSGYHLHGTLTPEFQEAESWAQPVVVDGKLYLREQDQLMCYRLSVE